MADEAGATCRIAVLLASPDGHEVLVRDDAALGGPTLPSATVPFGDEPADGADDRRRGGDLRPADHPAPADPPCRRFRPPPHAHRHRGGAGRDRGRRWPTLGVGRSASRPAAAGGPARDPRMVARPRGRCRRLASSGRLDATRLVRACVGVDGRAHGAREPTARRPGARRLPVAALGRAANTVAVGRRLPEGRRAGLRARGIDHRGARGAVTGRRARGPRRGAGRELAADARHRRVAAGRRARAGLGRRPRGSRPGCSGRGRGRAASCSVPAPRRRTLDDLAEQVPAFVERLALGDRVGRDEHPAWRAAIPRLSAACARLQGAGVPETLVHGDLHPWNIARTPRGLIVFDWSDSAIGHPFVDLATTVIRTDDVAVRRRLAEAYLSAWPRGLPGRPGRGRRPRDGRRLAVPGAELSRDPRQHRPRGDARPRGRRPGLAGASAAGARPRDRGARTALTVDIQENATTWRAAWPARSRSKASSSSTSGRRRSMRRSTGSRPARNHSA